MIKLNHLLNFQVFLILFLLLASCKRTVQIEDSAKELQTVYKDSLLSKTLNQYVRFNYSLPESYADSLHFPLIYLLHGHGGTENDWFGEDGGQAADILATMAKDSIIPPMIAVSIGAGNSWYVDSVEQMETFYLEEFIPYFENKVNFTNQKQDRHLAGLSAGGFGGTRFSMKHPSLFQNVILLSPAAYTPLPPLNSSSRKVAAFAADSTFSNSIWKSYSYKHLQTDFLKNKQHPRYHISTGDDDVFNIVPVVTDLQQFFLKNNIHSELRITDGGHNWDCWNTNFKDGLISLFK